MTVAEWRAFLGGFPHVMMHLAGHAHEYFSALAQPLGGHPFWEVESASLADWPGQLRMLEVWDEDNGFLRIRALPFDSAEDSDRLAAEFRRRAAADFTSVPAVGEEPVGKNAPSTTPTRLTKLSKRACTRQVFPP